ncbi:MAG: SurA N-terminal domain-containing protein [Bacteroidaceae bacterium]|nr:SurA N-terminal domain-containing protein [Bacteroidaceae bacterium]
MATLQKIRSKGPLLLAVIGLALFAFIAEEAFRSWQTSSNNSKQQIGQIAGEDVSVQEYQNLVDELSDVMKLTQGTNTLTDDFMNQIKDQAWQNFVNYKLVSAECEKLGIKVTDAELQAIINEGTNQMLQGTPWVDQNTGRFDKDALKKFLAEYNKLDLSQLPSEYAEYYQRLYKFWQYVEKSLRQNTLVAKYQSLLANSFISNPISAKASFEGRTISKDILAVAIPYSALDSAAVTLTDADIKNLYQEKKEMFRQTVETRDIKYIDILVTPSQEDKVAMLSEMEELAAELNASADPTNIVRSCNSLLPYTGLAVKKSILPTEVANALDSVGVGALYKPEFNISDNTYTTFKYFGKVNQPDSIEFRQIQVSAETLDETRKLADSIYTALKGGAEFEALAQKYGQNGATTWLTGAQYEGANLDAQNTQFVKTLLGLNTNDPQLVNFDQFSAIIEVKNKKAYTEKYDVAVIKKQLDFSKDTYNKAYNDFSAFVAANQKLKDIEANAEEAGYKLLTRKDLYNNEHNVAGVSNTRDAMKWIFDEAKVGEVSPLYACGNNDHLMVVALTGINKEGYRPFEVAKSDLRAEALRNKQAEKILADVANVKTIDQAKAVANAKSDTIKHITFSAPTFVGMTISSEPVLSGAVAQAKKGAFTGPIKGNGGVFMFQVINEENGTEKFDEKTEEQRLKQTALQAASQYTYDLYQKANVKDNRYLYF